MACCAVLSLLFFHSYFGPWAQQIRVQFYEDFLQAVDYAGGEDFRELNITPDVQFQGSRQVSEILTLYALELDADYYRGETGESPAYRERYHYRNLQPEDLAAPREGAAWVLKKGTLPAQLPPGWTVKDFGDYAVLYYEGE